MGGGGLSRYYFEAYNVLGDPSVEIWREEPQTICGDSNADTTVDLGDIVYLVNYIYKDGPEPRFRMCIGDCNNDTVVDNGDMVYLIDYLFNGGLAPQNCCG